MVKIEPKSSFASLPITARATALVLGGDPKGKNFLYCSSNSVVIRDIENPKEHDSYYTHKKQPICAKYAKTGFYICSGDVSGVVQIWDTTQKEHLTKYEYHPISGVIRDIAWDADSKRIAVCGEGKEKFAHAFLWDSGSSLGSLDQITKSANSVDIRHTRPYRCAVASEDFSTYFYEGPPFKYSTTMSKGTRFSNCVRFSPDGKYMATSNSDGNIFLCDGKTAEVIGKFGEPKAHNGGVYSVCFSPDSTELLSASADKSCKIWNVDSRQMVVEFVLGKEIADQQLSCLWQGDYLLSVSLSGNINYLDRNNPSTPARVITGHNKSIQTLATKKGEAIFTASFDGNIVKWNAETGDAIRFSGKGHGSMVKQLHYMASTNKLVSVGQDNKVRITDCDTCQFSSDNVIALDSEPTSLAVTSDGDIVVACAKELALIQDGKMVSSHPWNADYKVLVTAQGKKVVASGRPATGFNQIGEDCYVFDIDRSNLIKTDTSFRVSNSVSALAFSPDGSKLAVANNKVINIYELSDGFKEEPQMLQGHTNNVFCLAWSENSQYLASGSVDSSLFIWDVANADNHTWHRRCHPKSNIRGVSWLDDNTIVSAAEDCTVKQWTVSF